MPRTTVKYLFGRLNIIATYEDKKEYLLTGLRTSKQIEVRKSLWGFYRVEEVETEFGSFIHGYLVKYKASAQEEVAVPESHELDTYEVPNSVLAKARFFLHINSGLLVYHPVQSIISKKIFSERFTKLFSEAFDGFFVDADIQSIDEPAKVMEAIQKFQIISRVSIRLHPSNPSNREIWKRTDERMKKLGMIDYKETYESKRDASLHDLVEDEDLKAKVTMAEDGYGKATVTGTLDGHRQSVSTGDNPVSQNASGDSEIAENVLAQLSATMRRIFARFMQ